MKDHELAIKALRESWNTGLYGTYPPPVGNPDPGWGSANIGLMAAAAEYIGGRKQATRMLARDWIMKRLNQELGGKFMMNEPTSPVYGDWHCAAWAAIGREAEDIGDELIASMVFQWMTNYARLLAICAAWRPQPGLEDVMKGPAVFQPGMRSKTKRVVYQHVKPRMLALFMHIDPYKWRDGDRSEIIRYMDADWQWPSEFLKQWIDHESGAHRELAEELRGAVFDGRQVGGLLGFKGVKFRAIRYSTDSFAAWYSHNINGNTPPCLGVVVDPTQHAPVVLQPHGDSRSSVGPGFCSVFSSVQGDDLLVAEGYSKENVLIEKQVGHLRPAHLVVLDYSA